MKYRSHCTAFVTFSLFTWTWPNMTLGIFDRRSLSSAALLYRCPPLNPYAQGQTNAPPFAHGISTALTQIGFIGGTVTLKFTNPCRTTTLPCDAIPIVSIYQADGKTLATKAIISHGNSYKVELPAGRYVVFTQSGPSKDVIQTNQLLVNAGQTTILNLVDPVERQQSSP